MQQRGHCCQSPGPQTEMKGLSSASPAPQRSLELLRHALWPQRRSSPGQLQYFRQSHQHLKGSHCLGLCLWVAAHLPTVAALWLNGRHRLPSLLPFWPMDGPLPQPAPEVAKHLFQWRSGPLPATSALALLQLPLARLLPLAPRERHSCWASSP